MKRNLMGGLVATLVTASALAVAPLAPPSAHADPGSVLKAKPRDDAHQKARRSAKALIASQAPQLRTSDDEQFAAAPVVSGGAGLQYASYTRTYDGLPVRGGDFVVVTDRDGKILDTSVAQKKVIGRLSVTPTRTAGAATATAKGTLRDAELRGTPELVVHALAAPRLAWKVTVSGLTADGDRSVRDVYVDAKQGFVIESDELVHFATGTGNGHHNGPGLAIETTQASASSYTLADPGNPGVDCRIDNNTTNSVPVVSGPDNSWGDGSGTSTETGCVDTLYALQVQDRMLSQWLGRDGFNGNGGGWQARVGKDEVNAFYCPPGLSEPGYCTGTEWVRIGHNQAGTEWLTNLDVVGHEYGHGVDQNTPGGHSNGNTGEFVGDVFGALTEHYANESSTYDEPDYLVGEEVNLVGDGEIRNMYNPSAKGDPNCYSSSIPNAEVHSAAGPGNHWFYLLAEGTNPAGGPTSTTCNNGGTLTGIGIQKAGKIFYNAMLMKTTSSSYLKYRTWTLSAAKNLFPGSCAEFNAVKAAWNAVSVPAQTADPTCTTAGNTVTVTNPGNRTGTVGTATSLQLTGSSSGAGQTLTWSATGLPAGLTINASTGLVSGTPTAAATSNVTVTAKDTTGATGSTSFTWTISTSGGGPTGNLLQNPGFESGAVSWTGTSGPITNNTGRAARTGSWKMWLGGNGSTSTENESQTVTIPATATTASLSFWVAIDSAETTTSTAYDTAKVQVVNGATTSTLATYSNLNKSSGYVQKTFDLAAYKGKTITLKFLMNEDSSLQTSFVIDDTAINVG